MVWLGVALSTTVLPGMPWFTSQVAMALLVVACCMREDHALAALLQLRWLTYLGTISYGLYMLHMLCKNTVSKAFALTGLELDAGSFFFATLLLSIVVASLSFRFFESRFLRMKGRFERTVAAVPSQA
jgi:peptidoglycan/LPS O-acetylase OafA/YrhL